MITNLIFIIVTLLFSGKCRSELHKNARSRVKSYYVVTTNTAHCVRLVTAEKWSIILAVSSTSLLFFWRVRAVYKDSPIVCGLFFLSWMAVSCSCILHTRFQVFLLDLERIREAGQCFTVGEYSAFIMTSTLVSMVNDLLIFCAITYRLMNMAEVGDPTPKKRLMVAVSGRHLPAFPRTLLQDGQAYFL